MVLEIGNKKGASVKAASLYLNYPFMDPAANPPWVSGSFVVVNKGADLQPVNLNSR